MFNHFSTLSPLPTFVREATKRRIGTAPTRQKGLSGGSTSQASPPFMLLLIVALLTATWWSLSCVSSRLGLCAVLTTRLTLSDQISNLCRMDPRLFLLENVRVTNTVKAHRLLSPLICVERNVMSYCCAAC
jgi:hypothetical protein